MERERDLGGLKHFRCYGVQDGRVAGGWQIRVGPVVADIPRNLVLWWCLHARRALGSHVWDGVDAGVRR
jgi:hypothetical protein